MQHWTKLRSWRNSSTNLETNYVDTVTAVILVMLTAAYVSGEFDGTLVVMTIFPLLAYLRYAVNVDIDLLLEDQSATPRILGNNIAFAGHFTITTLVACVFGNAEVAFFYALVLWHLYMIQMDRLSQKILKEDKR